MSHASAEDLFPEWPSFWEVVQQRGFTEGTACAAWTVRELVAHQAGNAAELARVLATFVAGDPVPPREASKSASRRRRPHVRRHGGWNRPIRFAHGTGGHMAVLDVAEQARQHGVRRLVFAHIGRPSLRAIDAGCRLPSGEWGQPGRTYRVGGSRAASADAAGFQTSQAR